MRIWTLVLASALLWSQQTQMREAALGAQLAKVVRFGTTAIDNAAVCNYVEQLGQKLAIHFPAAVSSKRSCSVDTQFIVAL